MARAHQDLIKTVAGRWHTVSGDRYFNGLTISLDGTYTCNSGKVTDGGVHPTGGSSQRKLSLKRNCSDANDHCFEVDETGKKMKGHCPQSGCSWELEKEGATPAGSSG